MNKFPKARDEFSRFKSHKKSSDRNLFRFWFFISQRIIFSFQAIKFVFDEEKNIHIIFT